MSPYASRSRTSSVTDRRLITDLSTAPYDQKDLCVFCQTYTSVESLTTKTAGPLKGPSLSTIHFTPRYDRFVCFLLQVPQTSNSSATTTLCSFINKTSICHLKFFHYSVVLIGCRPVMSSFSDDPLSQFTAKPFLRCKQAREPTYRCQQLKANIYI